MKNRKDRPPQRTFLYRVMAFVARGQIAYYVRIMQQPTVLFSLFVISAGTIAMAILSTLAFLTQLPILFPPLAASAFMIFHRPLQSRSCPRTVILSHSVALIGGLLSLVCFASLFPTSNILNPWVMSWSRVGANALAMALAGLTMIALRCPHSPAAATALIASMGFVSHPVQIAGYLAALVLLVLEAMFFNRVLGGLPYPYWSHDPMAVLAYKKLADLSENKTSIWRQAYSICRRGAYLDET